MEGEATVVVVYVGEPPGSLLQQLREVGLRVIEAHFSEAEEQVEEHRPALAVIAGARGATELSTLLEDQHGERPTKMVVAAERRELSRLYGLNRQVVISLLATEMGDKVVAKRVAALARQESRGHGSQQDSTPKTTPGMPTGMQPQEIEAGKDSTPKTTPGMPIGAPPQKTEKDSPPKTTPGMPTGVQPQKTEAKPERARPAAAAPNAPEPKAEAKPEPKTAAPSTPEPKPEAKPKPKTAAPNTPEPKPEAKPKPKTAAPNTPEPKPEAKPTPQGEPDIQGSAIKPRTRSPSDEQTDELNAALLESLPPGAPTRAPVERRHSRPGDDPDRFYADIDAATAALDQLERPHSKKPSPLGAVSLAPDALESLSPADGIEEPSSDPERLQLEPTPGGESLTAEAEAPSAPGFQAPSTSTPLAETPTSKQVAETPDEEAPLPSADPASTNPEPTHREPPTDRSPQARKTERQHAQRAKKRTLPIALGLVALAAVVGLGIAASQKLTGPRRPASSLLSQEASPPVAERTDEAPSAGPPSEETEEGDTQQTEAPAASEDSAGTIPNDDASEAARPTDNPFEIEDAKLPSCKELVGDVAAAGDAIQEASVLWKEGRQNIVKGDLKTANLQMCKAVALNPGSAALEGLALLYSTRSSPAEALKWVNKALAVRPDDRDTKNLRGDVLSQLGRNEEALEAWLGAMNVSADDQGLRAGLAKNYLTEGQKDLRQGNYPRAERLLRRAVGLDPTNVLAPPALAEVFLKTERMTNARALAELTLELNEYDPTAYLILGDVALAGGDKALAKQHYERALRIRTDFWPAKKKLSELEGQ